MTSTNSIVSNAMKARNASAFDEGAMRARAKELSVRWRDMRQKAEAFKMDCFDFDDDAKEYLAANKDNGLRDFLAKMRKVLTPLDKFTNTGVAEISQ